MSDSAVLIVIRRDCNRFIGTAVTIYTRMCTIFLLEIDIKGSVQYFCQKPIQKGVPVSEVGTATGYGLDDRGVGVRVPVGSRIFSSSRRPDRLGTLSPVVKRPGCEADHSPPASAEVKKMWIYTSTPTYSFMA
jgi:hypothetical protein